MACDARFQRVDNGSVRWYDLDFPEVIKLRRQLLPPETARQTQVAASALGSEVAAGGGCRRREVLLVSEGVVMYFTPAEMQTFGDRRRNYRVVHAPFDLIPRWRIVCESSMMPWRRWGRNSAGAQDGSEVLQWAEGLRQRLLADPTDEMRTASDPLETACSPARSLGKQSDRDVSLGVAAQVGATDAIGRAAPVLSDF